MNKFIITEEEKNRILNMHKSKSYLMEEKQDCSKVSKSNLDAIKAAAKNEWPDEESNGWKLFNQQLSSLENRNYFKIAGGNEGQFKQMVVADNSSDSTNCFGTRLPFNEENYQFRKIGADLYIGVKK